MSAQRSRIHGRRHKGMSGNAVSLSGRPQQLKGCLSEVMKTNNRMCLDWMFFFSISKINQSTINVQSLKIKARGLAGITEEETHTDLLPSGSGSKVMAVLKRPLPRLTRWGRSAWTFKDFPVSIRSKGVLCQKQNLFGLKRRKISPSKST